MNVNYYYNAVKKYGEIMVEGVPTKSQRWLEQENVVKCPEI